MVDAPATYGEPQLAKSHSSAVSSRSWDKYANANRREPVRLSSIIAAFDNVILIGLRLRTSGYEYNCYNEPFTD